MGLEILAGPGKYPRSAAIHHSGGAALVVRMNSIFTAARLEREKQEEALAAKKSHEWYRQLTTLELQVIEPDDFRAANAVLPWTLAGFFEWSDLNIPAYRKDSRKSWGREIDQEMFDEARDFVKLCAQQGYDAQYH
jgi:hypothetical protein